MYTVYAIYNSEHARIYIGQTIDMIERLNIHKEKIFKNSYTSRYSGEWKIIYQEHYETRSDALVREKQLKSYRGRQFIKSHIPR